MLTRIPFYRDLIISSFTCDNCGYQNNSTQSANKIQDLGVKIKLLVKTQADLNREMVKSDYALFKIPSIDFEIQPQTQKGMLTTIEGMIDTVTSNLEADVEMRKDQNPELAEKLSEFIKKLNSLKNLQEPFEVILDDPSGDSFIENPIAPNKDPQLQIAHYKRTNEQNEEYGFDDEALNEDTNDKEDDEETDLRNEVCKFQGNCPNCNGNYNGLNNKFKF
jgi:zinc finger protein